MWDAVALAFDRAFIKPDVDAEERLLRVYLALFSITYVPPAGVFVWFHIRAGRTTEAAAIVAAMAALMGSLVVTRFAGDLRWAYRIVALVIVGVVAFQLYIGGGGGYAVVWFYLAPPVSFYLFGTREGWVWAAGCLVLAGALLLPVVGPTYPVGLTSRFIVTYSIEVVLALGLQRSREVLLNKLKAEKQELQTALAEVRTLSGMLPMCAWCRKIRDDQGFWSQIEEYLERQTGAVVSHGLCPECAEKVEEE